MILNAPWYVRNDDIRETLGVPSVEATIENINVRESLANLITSFTKEKKSYTQIE